MIKVFREPELVQRVSSSTAQLACFFEAKIP